MGRRTVVLHIGTHKTGTTSLQTMVARNQQWFRDQGLYYPLTARGSIDGDGHHNLAWELNGDERYDPRNGSLADLAEELRRAQARSALLSSEDFEFLYREPSKLDVLRANLEQLGYAVEILVVLRQPSQYVESLYTELLKHGLGKNLDEFVAHALMEGGVLFRNWDFRLNYEQLVSGFASIFGARHIHVLPYDPIDSVEPVLDATGRLLGLSLTPIAPWEHFNERPPLKVSRELEASSVGRAGAVDANSTRVVLTTAERDMIDSTFSSSVKSMGRSWSSRDRGALARLPFVKHRSEIREAQRHVKHLEAVVANLKSETAEVKEAHEQQTSELLKAQGYARQVESELLKAQGYARQVESAVAKLEVEIKELREQESSAPLCGHGPALECELRDRMNEIWLLHSQLEMLRRDLEVKDSFLKSVPTARKTPVETLGYEFPIDAGKTSVIGYRAVDRMVSLIRKLPGWSRVSETAWRADRQHSDG